MHVASSVPKQHVTSGNGIDVIEDIKNTENVICVAGLEMKAEAILGAVRGGYINTLITDEEAAKAVLALCK